MDDQNKRRDLHTHSHCVPSSSLSLFLDDIIQQHKRCRTNTIQIVDELKNIEDYKKLREELPGITLIQVCIYVVYPILYASSPILEFSKSNPSSLLKYSIIEEDRVLKMFFCFYRAGNSCGGR